MKRRDIALAGAAAVAFVVLLASVWAASCGSPSSADELLAGARPSYSDLTDRVVALERQVFILTARVSALESTTTTTVAPTTTTTLPPTTTTVKPTTTTTVPPTTTTTTTVPAAMLNVKDYGAKGDGATDDIGAIQAAIHVAANQDKGLYFPDGTYRISWPIWLPTGDSTYDNLIIRGAGIGKTVIVMNAQSASTYMFTAANISGLVLSDMTFRCPTNYRNNVRAVYATGIQNGRLTNLRVENCDYGFKLGSGNQAYGWVCDNLQSVNVGILSMFLAYVSDSTFRNLDFQNRVDTGEGMCLYIERENHNLVLVNVRCVGGSRNSLQFSNDYGTNPTDHVTIDGLYCDNSMGTRYPFTVAATREGMFLDITLKNVTLVGNNSENPCIVWYVGQRVIIDGLTASGGAAMQMKYGTFSEPKNCQIKNGTYRGSVIGVVLGVTVTNVSLGGL